MPDWIVTLSHPDFNRRPRNYTGSADLFAMAKALAGFQPALRVPSRLAVMRNALNIADLPPGEFRPALRISGLTITLLITFINAFTPYDVTQFWFMASTYRTTIRANTYQFRETTMIDPKKLSKSHASS